MLTDGLLNFLFDIKLAFLCIPEYSSRGWYLLLCILISYFIIKYFNLIRIIILKLLVSIIIS